MMSSGSPQRVFVTGSAGFLGSHFVRWLAEAGCDARGCDSYVSSRWSPDAPAPRTVRGSASATLRDMLAGGESTDVLIHAAAYVSESLSGVRPGHVWRCNVDETAATVEAACRAGVGRVIYVSSCAVYGSAGTGRPQDESLVPSPVDPYGASKLAGELAVRSLCESYGVPWCAVRLHNVYGPGQVAGYGVGRSVVAIWMEHLYRGLPMPMVGTGDAVRSWTFVDDLRPAIVDLCGPEDTFAAAAGRAWNVGDGTLCPVSELRQYLLIAADRDDPGVVALPQRHEPRWVSPSCRDWTATFGALPRTMLVEGLRQTWRWYAAWRDGVADLPSWDCGAAEL